MKITYKEIDGYFGFEDFYSTTAFNYLKDGMNVVEMGVHNGRSISFLADKIKSNGLKVNLYGVDRWLLDEEYNRFIQYMKDCEVLDYIIPIRMLSDKAAEQFPDGFFDFIFLDGSHDYQSVKNDMEWWFPKLKVGGLFSGDDYVDCWPEVAKAVDERFGSDVLKQFPVWYLFKK